MLACSFLKRNKVRLEVTAYSIQHTRSRLISLKDCGSCGQLLEVEPGAGTAIKAGFMFDSKASQFRTVRFPTKIMSRKACSIKKTQKGGGQA